MANEPQRLVRDASDHENSGASSATCEVGTSAVAARAEPTGTGGASTASGMATQSPSKPIDVVEVASGAGGASSAGTMVTGSPIAPKD